LAPYLLSSIDHGVGMMMAINETPIDYLTWGNHEADIPHKDVCKHVKNFKGTFSKWIVAHHMFL
jgi:2',3'-cyclic-nucleotide 2'-phosphodiesterase (5'-nucleotidase family)